MGSASDLLATGTVAGANVQNLDIISEISILTMPIYPPRMAIRAASADRDISAMQDAPARRLDQHLPPAEKGSSRALARVEEAPSL